MERLISVGFFIVVLILLFSATNGYTDIWDWFNCPISPNILKSFKDYNVQINKSFNPSEIQISRAFAWGEQNIFGHWSISSVTAAQVLKHLCLANQASYWHLNLFRSKETRIKGSNHVLEVLRKSWENPVRKEDEKIYIYVYLYPWFFCCYRFVIV